MKPTKYKEQMYTDRFGFNIWDDSQQKIYCLFRFDPIPAAGIGWGRSRSYKLPRTANIKRDESPYNRGKRRRKSMGLWNRWDDDDVMRANHNNRNWKSCTKRKNQFKLK